MRRMGASLAAVIATLAAVACGGSSDVAVSSDLTDGGDGGSAPPVDAQGSVDATTINDSGANDATSTTGDAGADDGANDATSPTGDAGADDGASSLRCIPGQSIGCVGAGGCASSQACDVDGTGFYPCICPGDGGSTVCAPGQSVACVGPGGCASNQVCRNDGTGFGTCACASANDAGPPEVCIPGESIGCVGFGGCTSSQVCNDAGSGYGACTCANDGGHSLACVPGQSIACSGVGGCSGFQVCKGDGSAYDVCHCPDAGAGDAGALDASVGWTPAQLPGLALWLDDTYGFVSDPAHPGYLVHWRDRSGNGNDGTMQPGTIYLDPQTVNGLDAIAFQGTPMTIADSPSLDWGTGSFAIIMLKTGLQDSMPGQSYVGWIWQQGNLTLSLTNQLQLVIDGQTFAESVFSPKRFQILTLRGQPAIALASDSTVLTGTANSAATGGGISIGNLTFVGEVVEIIAVKGALSDADLAKATGYLKTKFALP